MREMNTEKYGMYQKSIDMISIFFFFFCENFRFGFVNELLVIKTG